MKYLILSYFIFISTVLSKEIQFYDQGNNKVTLKKTAQNVVTIPIPLASLSIAIDKNCTRLSSINPISKEAMNKSILNKIFLESLNISTKGINNGFLPNIEELLLLNPDIIFQWGHLGANTIAPLKNAGLKIALLKYGKEKYTQKWFEMLGSAYGQESRVEEILRHRNSIKSKLEEISKQIKRESKPKVLYFLRFNSSMRVAGKNTFNDYSIKLAGGINASQVTNFREVGIEQLIEYNPEIILLNNFEEKLTPQDIYSHPILSLTKAAINKQIYKVPLGGTRWDPPGQESPLLWLWLFKLFHPQLVDFDLNEEIKKAYKLLYNYKLTEKEINMILHIKINKESKYYKDNN